MIQKQSNNHHSGRAHNHQEQEGMADPEFNNEHDHCSFFFFTRTGLFTVNLFLLTLWSTLTFTATFWGAWEKMCDKKDWNFGATTTGSFIMTMCPPTHPWKLQSFWLTTKWLFFPILHTCWTLPPCDFALFSKLKMKLKGWRFETAWHPKEIESGTQQH
jgi:hypothetical protein